jgi:hypothetical protein
MHPPVLEREKRQDLSVLLRLVCTTAFEHYVPTSCNHAAGIYPALAAYWLQLATRCGEALKIPWRLICCMLKNRMTKTTMKPIMRFNTTTIFQKFVVHRASQFGILMDDSRCQLALVAPLPFSWAGVT